MSTGATTTDPAGDAWPDLPLASWADTQATLHRWLQIVGKVRLTLSPPQNHCWNATFYVTANGLTTSPIPHPAGTFMVDFDFCAQRLVVRTQEGATTASNAPTIAAPVTSSQATSISSDQVW